MPRTVRSIGVNGERAEGVLPSGPVMPSGRADIPSDSQKWMEGSVSVACRIHTRPNTGELMRITEVCHAWVVYRMTLHGNAVGGNVVCEQREWDALDRPAGISHSPALWD